LIVGLPGRIRCEQMPWFQRKLWACFWLCSSSVSSFSVSLSLVFPCMAYAFFPNTCLIIAMASITLFPRLQVSCCSFVGSIAKLHQAKRLQIKGHKNQHVHQAVWNSVYWLPRYASTIIYCFIMLLQLLYSWRTSPGYYG
jgi:hypothetical protein